MQNGLPHQRSEGAVLNGAMSQSIQWLVFHGILVFFLRGSQPSCHLIGVQMASVGHGQWVNEGSKGTGFCRKQNASPKMMVRYMI